MQQEIDGAAPAKPVHILGINFTGLEDYNESFCYGRTLPWLQDTAAQNVWGSWAVTWRDVFILDAENRVIDVYNLTDHSLEVGANRDELRAKLLAAAAR